MLHEGSFPRQAEEIEGLKPQNGEQEERIGVSHCSPDCSLARKHKRSGVRQLDGLGSLPVRGGVSSSHRT